jgi:hypothetical protein
VRKRISVFLREEKMADNDNNQPPAPAPAEKREKRAVPFDKGHRCGGKHVHGDPEKVCYETADGHFVCKCTHFKKGHNRKGNYELEHLLAIAAYEAQMHLQFRPAGGVDCNKKWELFCHELATKHPVFNKFAKLVFATIRTRLTGVSSLFTCLLLQHA